MPRPKRTRHINSRPIASEFRPTGIRPNEEIVLSLEEFEAIRLIDYQRMDQSQAAEIMNVSRQTVGRILKVGRYKLSKSIVEALCLKVSGGCYKIRPDNTVAQARGPGMDQGQGLGRKRHGRGRGRGKNRFSPKEE